MIRKKILNPERIRSIKGGGFSFIPHRFVTDGFLQRLSGAELLLYLFLTAVSDRYGLSFYSDESICTLLDMSSENYQSAIKGRTRAVVHCGNAQGIPEHLVRSKDCCAHRPQEYNLREPYQRSHCAMAITP